MKNNHTYYNYSYEETFHLYCTRNNLIASSCKNEDPSTTRFVDPAIAEIYKDYHSYSLKNPKLKMFFQNPDWDRAKSSKSGDTVLYQIPFSNTRVINQVLLVKTIRGHNQFDIQIQNANARLSGEDPEVRHIYFPVHPEMANGKISGGGHNCGGCHDYAWWDTFDEVTITSTSPVNNDPYVPDWWGGDSMYPTIFATVYTSYIENQLTSPCFNNVLNQMRKGRFDNKVQDILAKSSSLDLIIRQAPVMSDGNPQKAAETLGNTIVLNSTLMANASQEFVATVIYHEVLHRYINNREIYDHNTMASKYVAPMVQALMSWFPLTPGDAEALAWSGLQKTPSYSQDRRDALNIINNRYLNHTYGHTCQ